MTRQQQILITSACLFAVLAGGAGYWLGTSSLSSGSAPSEMEISDGESAAGSEADREVLYWYDPMVPGQRFDEPGKSPFMDMQLVPKYADEVGSGGVRVSPAMVQSLGIRTGKVAMTDFFSTVEAVGRIEIDERRVAEVQTLTPGYVERLSVRAEGEQVQRGENLARIYAPDLLAAQAEFAALVEMPAQVAPASLRQAARDRLRLLGLSRGAIRSLEDGGAPQRTYSLFSPVSGVVTDIGALPGARVGAGQSIMTVADLSQVWAIAEVPEVALGQIRIGLPVDVSFPAYPEERRTGQVDYIYPTLDTSSRTARIRVTLANPDLKLKAGMFANMSIGGTGGLALTVPSEAVIRTGKRDIVMLEENGAFRPVEVEIGREAGERTQILTGLDEGDAIVLSGQFLIDSEAQLSGLVARLGSQADEAVQEGTADIVQASGKILTLEPGDRKVTIAHGPVPALNWPSMNMGFAVADGAQLRGYKPGDEVRFSFAREPQDGAYMIEDIARSDSK